MKILILSLLFAFKAVADSRKKIIVLDTGINREMSKQAFMCQNGVQFTIGVDGYDTHGHGSNIIGIITKGLDTKKYCIVSIKVFHHYFRKGHEFWKFNITGGLRIALNLNMSYLNMSLGGTGTDLLEKHQLTKAVAQKVAVVVAAGNKSEDLDKTCNYFPACYKLPGVFVVGNGHSAKSKSKSSNYGRIVTNWRDGNRIYAGGSSLSGTSQSTAILTRDLVKKEYTNSKN